MERGQIVFEETHLVDEEFWQDDESEDYDGWFCVRTNPFPCPAAGCTFVAEFMTAAHLILVWQESDDPNLLRHAARARDVGRNPRVVGYRSEYGPSASYYAWIAAGRPGARREGGDVDDGDCLGDDPGERHPLRALRDAARQGARGSRGPRGRQRDADGAGHRWPTTTSSPSRDALLAAMARGGFRELQLAYAHARGMRFP